MKDQLIEKMYEWTKKPYQRFFKNKKAWNIEKQELLAYPQETLGYHLEYFLQKNNFDIQPKLEDHDIIHVLTNTGISVREEIGMQYYLLGNGKNSLYFISRYSGWNNLLSYSYRLFHQGISKRKKSFSVLLFGFFKNAFNTNFNYSTHF